jgi:hypothetical protein
LEIKVKKRQNIIMSDNWKENTYALEKKVDEVVAQLRVDLKYLSETMKAVEKQSPSGHAGDACLEEIVKVRQIVQLLDEFDTKLTYMENNEWPHKDIKKARAANPDTRNYDLC